MSILSRSLLATAAVVAMMWNIPAHALSMHECSVKYHAAQTDKTLNGMTWKDFRKAEWRTRRRGGPDQHVHEGRGHGSCGRAQAQHCRVVQVHAHLQYRAGRRRRLAGCGVAEICRQVHRQGADAHLSRSVRGQ